MSRARVTGLRNIEAERAERWAWAENATCLGPDAQLAQSRDRGRAVPSTLADYRNAALERMGDAGQLKRLERYPFAMYAAGVAVECMLRAFRHPDREHAAHHDVAAHFAACDRSRLGERAWAKLRGPVQTVHLLWLHGFRYTDRGRLRRHLKDIRYYERPKRDSDALKVACIELCDAAFAIVTMGDERWRNP